VLLAFVAALGEHGRAAPAAGHVLLGAFGGFALPLLVFVIVGAALGGQGLARAGRALTAFGESPVATAMSVLLVSVGVSMLSSGALSAAVAGIAHGPSDPPRLTDAMTSGWIGGLAGAAYAAYFGFGAAILRNGAGRAILLAADWVLGGEGSGAIFTPRAHLRSLFGGAAPLDVPQRASVALLIVLIFVYACAALLLARRARV
jgi:hypothetical protein